MQNKTGRYQEAEAPTLIPGEGALAPAKRRRLVAQGPRDTLGPGWTRLQCAGDTNPRLRDGGDAAVAPHTDVLGPTVLFFAFVTGREKQKSTGGSPSRHTKRGGGLLNSSPTPPANMDEEVADTLPLLQRKRSSDCLIPLLIGKRTGESKE